MINTSDIFRIRNDQEFDSVALELFKYQAHKNPIYKNYINLLGIEIDRIDSVKKIPFLPIQLFKDFVVSTKKQHEKIFSSSGTGGKQSKHHIADLAIYEQSFRQGFEYFYGDITEYTVLALLPSYLEREGSSLIYMCEKLMKDSGKKNNGFYLNEHHKLEKIIKKQDAKGEKTLLIGVSFGLLDFIENRSLTLHNTLIMETGGMKGRRKEIIREELHTILKKGFGVKEIHSEYGMTELLSQAYSHGNQKFTCPPWMRVSCRDINDPLSNGKKRGGLNVIDLANIHSCAFIATQDLGRVYNNGSFEVLGRFDSSDVRGCNLMVL